MPSKKIHKALYDETINRKPQYADKFLLGMMIKMANRAKKLRAKDKGELAGLIYSLFHDSKINAKAKKLINHDTMVIAENEKANIIEDFIEHNRDNSKWFYLASSHDDCAVDHKPYQGRLYIDEKAPESAMAYARSKNLKTMQWVMGAPAWFITRPNCRHYFVALTEGEVIGKNLKRAKRRYKTHTKEGNRQYQTPAHAAVEEYRDRLRFLRALYREYPTQRIKNEAVKTELLLKKWEKAL